MNEQQFRQQLSGLISLAGGQKMCVSEEQMKEYFPDVAENEEQKKLLLEYLASQKITVGEKADLDEFLSMEDKDYLEEYTESLSMIEVLDKDALSEIMLSAMAGDSEAQEIVLAQFLSQAVELAKLYAGQGILIEDLIGEGNLALAQAVRGLGCLETEGDVWEEVSGFLGKCMMEAMEQLINEEADEKNADFQIVNKVNRVADAADELSEQLRRKVSPEELCANTDLTMGEVAEAMRLSGNRIESVEMEITKDDNGK